MSGNPLGSDHSDRKFRWAGVLGLVGAVIVGIGEFTLQFTPQGGYESPGYTYFAAISMTRLSIGHFLSVLAAPLYLAGYWHLGQAFARGGSPRVGRFITLFGGYAFMIGVAWLGGRVYLALLVHEIAITTAPAINAQLTLLLENFSRHNEPLVNVLRIAMLLISLAWIICIIKGKTAYPKWMALFSPIAILSTIFAFYYIWPTAGVWLLPAAMNVTHAVVFGLSVYVTSTIPGNKTATMAMPNI